MATTFQDSSDLTLRQIRGACWRGDLIGLGELAHGLRASAAAAGASAFAALCRSLEAACQKDDWRVAARLVEDLAPALDRVRGEPPAADQG